MSESAFDDFLHHCEAFFDQLVVNGSDDELFASGYLRGHIDLVAAQLQLQAAPVPSLSALIPAVTQSLEDAKQELNPQDYQHIQQLWQRLQR